MGDTVLSDLFDIDVRYLIYLRKEAPERKPYHQLQMAVAQSLIQYLMRSCRHLVAKVVITVDALPAYFVDIGCNVCQSQH